MKAIKNWKNATVADLEADNLLDFATKLHVLGFQMTDSDEIKTFKAETESQRIVNFFKWHADNGVPVVMHNGVSFDTPLMEKLFDLDLSNLMLIDTLALSWYLNPKRPKHGLGSFWEDYGIAKPEVEDWSEQPYEVYQNRVTEDVKINVALWKDLKYRLVELYTMSKIAIDNGDVGGKRMDESEVIYLDSLVGLSVEQHIDRLLTFLMFKMDCARLQERTQWEVDVNLILETEAKLIIEVESTKAALESVMPRVPQFTKKEKPKKPFKKDGSPSSIGLKWTELMSQFDIGAVDESGILKVQKTEVPGVYKVLSGYEEPNAGSPHQIKSLLYSHGWIPATFKYEKDEELFSAWVAKKPKEGSKHGAWTAWKNERPPEREIPQVTKGGDDGKELCHSVLDLAEEIPEIMTYASFNVAKHRLGMVQGFKRDLREGKWLQARIGGFTNTLRVQHRELVNLPGYDKAFGVEIRGSLVAGEGKVLMGSDMSSLEDRVKHHFMLPHDPEYVKTMQAEDFDPHILMALTANMITVKEFDDFMKGIKTDNAKAARKKGKTTNYASVYNASAAAIARAAGVSLAEGKVLFEAYWKLNWSVKAIADEQVVVGDSRIGKWLVNPVNGFCYSLRKDSDRFSTLAQGTGSFFFDMWVDNILTEMENRYNRKTLTGSFHDEVILCLRDNKKITDEFEGIIRSAVGKVNVDYKLRRKLGCDVQTGKRYSQIH